MPIRKGTTYGESILPEIVRLIEVPQGKRCSKIDAAKAAADLTLNGQKIGSHAGGYSAFTFDITPYIQKNNTIEITVDNSRRYYPISADFTFWVVYTVMYGLSLPLLRTTFQF